MELNPTSSTLHMSVSTSEARISEGMKCCSIVKIVSIQLLVWGFALALVGTHANGVAELAAHDPLWLLHPVLIQYWIGLGLALVGLVLASRLSQWYKLGSVIVVALIARGLPTLISGLPYGRDAYMHWGSALLVANSGYVAIDAPPYTYLSLPLLFSWGGLVAKLVGIQTIEQALPLLVGWQIFVIALTVVIGLMICTKLTSHSLLQVAGAVTIAAGTPFLFVTHFSPLSIAAPILWGLFWLGLLPATPSRIFAQIVATLALIILHPFLPLLYLCFALLMQGIVWWQTKGQQNNHRTWLLSGFVCYVIWQVYVAASFSLPQGLNIIQTLIHIFQTFTLFESAQQNFASATPLLVSTIRWSLFAGFALLATAAMLLDFVRNRNLSIFAGCLVMSTFVALMAGFAGKYGEFAARALPFIIPFAILVILSSAPSQVLRLLTASLIILAIPLSVVAVHFEAPLRIALPADVRGLRYVADSVRHDDVVLVDTELRGFRDESLGQYFYDDMNRYRVQRVMQSQVVVVQAATQERVQSSGMNLSYQQSLDLLGTSWNRIYDNGRVIVYRR